MAKNTTEMGASSESNYDWLWSKLDRYLEKNLLKQTKQRRLIIEHFLSMSEKHVDAEELHLKIRSGGMNIGLATIYRTLNLLKDADLVEQSSFADGRSVFELKEPDSHHDHLVCLKCGHVIEFEDENLEDLKEKIAKNLGFRLASHRLDLYGDCEISNCSRGIN